MSTDYRCWLFHCLTYLFHRPPLLIVFSRLIYLCKNNRCDCFTISLTCAKTIAVTVLLSHLPVLLSHLPVQKQSLLKVSLSHLRLQKQSLWLFHYFTYLSTTTVADSFTVSPSCPQTIFADWYTLSPACPQTIFADWYILSPTCPQTIVADWYTVSPTCPQTIAADGYRSHYGTRTLSE